MLELLDASPSLLNRCISAIGSDSSEAGPTDAELELCRRAMNIVLEAKSLDPVRNGRVNTDLRADIIGAWRCLANDSDDQPEHWLQHGTPAGIRVDPASRDIFPIYTPEDNELPDDPELLAASPHMFQNYSGIEDDEDVMTELMMAKMGTT